MISVLESDFLDLTPKAKATKAKIRKWGCIKLKTFLHSKRHMKRQSVEWEKISANHVSSKSLTF